MNQLRLGPSEADMIAVHGKFDRVFKGGGLDHGDFLADIHTHIQYAVAYSAVTADLYDRSGFSRA